MSALGGGCVYVVHYSSLFQYPIYFSKGFLAVSWTVALACFLKKNLVLWQFDCTVKSKSIPFHLNV
jgi:hypothetical protein